MIKQVLIIGSLLMLTLIFGCKKESGTGIIGTWQLTEELLDPGDGSGVFTPVSSTKVIEFHENDTYSSNGETCHMTSYSGQNSEGTYSTSTMEPSECSLTTSITYELSGTELILRYPCFEPCAQKFTKL